MTKNRTRTPVYLDPGMHPGLEVKGLIKNHFNLQNNSTNDQYCSRGSVLCSITPSGVSISSPRIWKDVSVTSQSGRYILSYYRGRYVIADNLRYFDSMSILSSCLPLLSTSIPIFFLLIVSEILFSKIVNMKSYFCDKFEMELYSKWHRCIW